MKGRRDGQASIYTCPDCGGVLRELDEEGFARFQCHTGHLFSGEVLLAQQSEAIESSMWYAVRALVDKSRLATQLALQAQSRGHLASVAQFEEDARVARRHADALMALVQGGGTDQRSSTESRGTAA